MKKILILIFSCFSIFASVQAQEKKSAIKDYSSKPVWIEMMDDTAANFFEVEKAFATYFQHHEMPEAEHDVIGEVEQHEGRVSKRELRRRQAEDMMRMQLKKYEHWKFQVQPYVQEDGTILSPSKRLELWRAGNNSNN